MGSIAFEEMKANALGLAKAAKALGMPLVLTSSMEEYAQGPLLAELADIAPEEFAGRIQRQGVVNAFDDKNFADAVKATDRTNLIIAGVTNDVCTVFPTLTALAAATRSRSSPTPTAHPPRSPTTSPSAAWTRPAPPSPPPTSSG
ncbi:isochorismatase family protein [Streptomyces sp. NBC_01262]|uniref:isochorismatase family protein n=1 Tax=Streptomyces sp. NBC_01262 TaxID=2903803 RepID=UPI002E372449|nr:isochorismatase family protein [Streptomyces sp. NBC_01262]